MFRSIEVPSSIWLSISGTLEDCEVALKKCVVHSYQVGALFLQPSFIGSTPVVKAFEEIHFFLILAEEIYMYI